MPIDIRNAEEEEEEEEVFDISWSNLIFLPFSSSFQLIVLISVITKSILGPVQAVFPIVHCSTVMDDSHVLSIIKIFYCYCSDAIYATDTFFRILHRQVAEQAVRREHLPKSAFLLMLDILALIPFYNLVLNETCEDLKLIWPNILAFTEFLVVYRIMEYFSMVSTHSFKDILIGFLLMLIVIINCLTCMLLLITFYGLCVNCNQGIYDWRKFVWHNIKANGTNENFNTYFYGVTYVLTFIVNKKFDEMKPSTILEYLSMSLFICCAYSTVILIIVPKLFGEAHFRLRKYNIYYPIVSRITEETKNRNPSPNAHLEVEKFYRLMWKSHGGTTSIPNLIMRIPRYLRLDIKEDLVWPIFYHSPTFRRTSLPFQRYISEFIQLDFKLEGELFFSGPQSYTNLYYIKSGVVQLLSADDGITPLLSVISGTIFGDISFFLPNYRRKVVARCFTHCEVLLITRFEVVRSLRRYPTDRRMVINSAKERIKHARTLYSCKQNVHGLDRTEDEGIAWIKKRWWEISDLIQRQKKKSDIEKDSFTLPNEETSYHCAKYIGQLVLCNDVQSQNKTMFANVKFPWLLLPQSAFVLVWRRILFCTVYIVLLLFPPMLVKDDPPPWFIVLNMLTDLIYVVDIIISFITVVETSLQNTTFDFPSVMFARCRTWYFCLDVLSVISLENLTIIMEIPLYHNLVQFNRLIKIYVLYCDECLFRWDIKTSPMFIVTYNTALKIFSFMYITPFLIFLLLKTIPDFSPTYFFGELFCTKYIDRDECDFSVNNTLHLALWWNLEYLFNENWSRSTVDLYLAITVCIFMFIIFYYCKSRLVVGLYWKYRDAMNYQYFASNIEKHYKHHNIHPDLLWRLKRYLNCHWNYYRGMDVLYPNYWKDEPYDIYMKVHGDAAMKIIGESKAFAGADQSLVKELASKARFLVLPKQSTLFLFGVNCRGATWVVKGHVKCEYIDDNGDLYQYYVNNAQMLSVGTVFLGGAALRTYICKTECEILQININDFFNTIAKYPIEAGHFANCITEITPTFVKLFGNYINQHIDYQNSLHERIFHTRRTALERKASHQYSGLAVNKLVTMDVIILPQSDFMQKWILFRAIMVPLVIITSTLQGGSGAPIRKYLDLFGIFYTCVAWIDMILKIFLAYYDEKGILITSFRKCLLNYLTRGFLFDLAGAFPYWEMFSGFVPMNVLDDYSLLFNSFTKFFHLYLFTGYFDFISDSPSLRFPFLKLVKWLIVTIMMVFWSGHFFMVQCLNFEWDQNLELTNIRYLNTCWVLPTLDRRTNNISAEQLHLFQAESIHLAQSALFRMGTGKIVYRDREKLGVAFFFLGLIFWCIVCDCVAVLVLYFRGNSLFIHGINQLKKFLQGERVENDLIMRAVRHFRYWWMRTQGINIQNQIFDRVGVIFRQDLSFFFYKRTFEILDTLLQAGVPVQRQLASTSYQLYFLPKEDITREMDLVNCVYIVHRGEVAITYKGEKIAHLTKGAIFGPLATTINRPIRVTATATDYTDILQIPLKVFHDCISDETRKTIRSNSQYQYDYMSIKDEMAENPHDTIQYLLRGQKTLQFPWMAQPMDARIGTPYSYFLAAAYIVGPVITALIVLMMTTMPLDYIYKLLPVVIICDLLHIAFIVSEMFTMYLVVENNQLVMRHLEWSKIMQNWATYVDLLSVFLPLLTFYHYSWNYQLFRLLRLRLIASFNHHFCKNFSNTGMPAIIKFTMVVLVQHAIICGWIYVACQEEKFPVHVPEITAEINNTIDYYEWTHPNNRKGGCAIISKTYTLNGQRTRTFFVAKNWISDYILAMSFVIYIHTRNEVNSIVPLTIPQIYYKVVVNTIVFSMDLILLSASMSAVFTMLRELYIFDYDVQRLVAYLRYTGLSPLLLKAIEKYTTQLWQRQRGNWLPELAQQAPQCLREDLLGDLYMYHLDTPSIFRQLPYYFKRQLVARFHRVVIFPGHPIVKAGDIFQCIYFIHEGEVEKWITNPNYLCYLGSDCSGKDQMLALLNTNNYFGLIPGLFIGEPFKNTYISRTVVDLVFLKFRDWQDLLEAYPKEKKLLYNAARLLKKEFGTYRPMSDLKSTPSAQ